MTLAEMQARLRELLDELKTLRKTVSDEKRAMTEDEDKRYIEIEKQMDQLEADIQREQRHQEREQRLSQSLNQPPPPDPDDSGAADEHRFASFGEQLLAVRNAATPGGSVDPRLIEQRAGVPNDGGFLVQKDFATELLRKIYETGVLAGRTRTIPISANSNGLKINAVKETSRADGSRWGGVRAYWVDEAAAKTASKPKFRQMELNLQKLIGLCYATDELLQDASALGAFISMAFSEEFGFKVDDAIINGTGAGQPLGIMTGGGLVTVAKETGQLANTVVYENIVKMWARLWARSQQNAVWLINQDVQPELYNMGITVGTGGSPAFMPPGGLSQSPYATLMGRPIIPIEQCQTLGTTGDIILCDLNEYLMISKGGIESASSIHVRFVYDESVFRFVLRTDGQPIWNTALTPYKGTNTVSPYVVLATRA